MPTVDFTFTRLIIWGIFKIRHNEIVIILKISAIICRIPMLYGIVLRKWWYISLFSGYHTKRDSTGRINLCID